MPKRYPSEFRRRVLELLKAGKSVSEVAADLGLSTQTIYNWRHQEQIDSGLRPGVTSTEIRITHPVHLVGLHDKSQGVGPAGLDGDRR